jgi:hypothetical protein
MYIGSSFYFVFSSIAEVTELSYGRIVVKTTSLDQYADEARYSRVVIPVSGSGPPFHQHLFDCRPLLEHKLDQELIGVIRECNLVEKYSTAFLTLARKWLSGRSIWLIEYSTAFLTLFRKDSPDP